MRKSNCWFYLAGLSCSMYVDKEEFYNDFCNSFIVFYFRDFMDRILMLQLYIIYIYIYHICTQIYNIINNSLKVRLVPRY